MNRILFLDVDGVLNNMTWAEEMYDKNIKVFAENRLYEPSLRQLKRIIDETGALIVVSSSWRKIPTCFKALTEWLEKFGMRIYDVTPYVGGIRGDDIRAWFHRNPGDWSYAILDDDDDMAEFAGCLVQTDFGTGLTETEADRCIELLQREEKE